MFSTNRVAASLAALLIATAAAQCPAQSVRSSPSPISAFVNSRTRVDAWQWFAAPPTSNTYGYVESLLRLGVAQRIHHWDWRIEIKLTPEEDAALKNSAAAVKELCAVIGV